MEHTMIPRVVTEAEAAEILGVARRTLQDWRFRGVGPRYIAYSRRSVRYLVSDLLEYMERCARTSTVVEQDVAECRRQVHRAPPVVPM